MADAEFNVKQTTERLDVACGRRPVLSYHASRQDTWRTNYVHPLCAVGGESLTEDAPADHPHHRGVFWAWRRILLDGEPVCDSWTGRDFALRTSAPRVERRADGALAVLTDAMWLWTGRHPALALASEAVRITAFPDRKRARPVRIDIRLRARRPDLSIAGTDDEKGYGGPSLRLARPEALRFASEDRAVDAQPGAIAAGREMAFSWQPHPQRFPARVTVGCFVDGVAWTNWVLRTSPSMQNCAFPGRSPIRVPSDRDLHIALDLCIQGE